MNEILQGIFVLASGVWMIIIGFTVETHNFRSALVFKIIPFLLGVACLYIGCKMIGIV